MKPEDNQLLIRELYARLPYHVIVKYKDANVDLTKYVRSVKIEECKPYLRPLFSMTEEEYNSIRPKLGEHSIIYKNNGGFIFDKIKTCNFELIDWLLANHFDYRNLIERGLALEAPSDMYK